MHSTVNGFNDDECEGNTHDWCIALKKDNRVN